MDATTTTTDPVRVQRNDRVATLTFDRPEGRNSFDVATLQAMRIAVQGVVDDPTIRAVVLTGNGKTFCAGADVRAMRDAKDPARLLDDLTLHFHALLQTIRQADTAFVMAVNGVAAGGGVGLALAGDLIVMARSARLVCAYANLGISPDGGATMHLVRALGPVRAREAILLDEGIDAESAWAAGLVNRVADDGDVLSVAEEMATTVAARSRHTVGQTKRLVDLATHAAADVVLEAERKAIIAAGHTKDFREGLTAFFEKRAPRFA